MLQPEDRIGPYTLIRQLGRGSFGAVWLAERRTPLATTQVALKLPLEATPDLKAISKESQLWARAGGHANVLPIIEADIYDGQVVIVSEYAPDGSLEGWLKKYNGIAPSVEAAITMITGILAGLAHLHGKQIVHRDLKPANILLQGDTPRLADFGLARVLKASASSGAVAGTPIYMAPEVFDGKRSELSDLWAAGVLFYQLLAGFLPFPHQEMGELMGAIINKPPYPLPVTVPAQLQQIVMRALEKDQRQRYQSATEMRAAIQSYTLPGGAITGPLFAPIVMPIAPARSDTVRSDTALSGTLPTLALSKLMASEARALSICEFECVTLNEKGRVKERRTLQASYYTEDVDNISIDMIHVPAGTFSIGSDDNEKARGLDEGPRMEIRVAPFFLGKTPVTQAQWRAVARLPKVERELEAEPSGFKGDSLPVERVSWYDALEFCARLTALTGRDYRLPDEAEWEYACRAGTTTPFAFGDTITPEIVNYDGNYPYGAAARGHYLERTREWMSARAANAFGLIDMHGNVWEWCMDAYRGHYAPVQAATTEVSNSSAVMRVLRGGSWCDMAGFCRSAHRNRNLPGYRNINVGFRIAARMKS